MLRNEKLIDVANRTPKLLSLLSDIGLMPEQCVTEEHFDTFHLVVSVYLQGLIDGGSNEIF